MSCICTALTVLSVGCGAPGTSAGSSSEAEASGEAQPSRTRSQARNNLAAVQAVARLAVSPGAEDLLVALSAEHRRLRGSLGPHSIRATVTMSTTPSDVLRPRVGQPRGRALVVTDKLELDWIGGASGRESFRISQANEQPEGRGAARVLLVVDEWAYLQQDGRQWFERAREDEEGIVWIEDIYRCVADAVELGAPSLSLEALPPGSVDGRPTTRVGLTKSSATDSKRLPANERSAWRAAAKISELHGEIELDPETGAWLSAQVHVVLSHDGDAAWRLNLDLEAQLRSQPPGVLEIPTQTQPLPRRERYEPERARLLDGLAGG